MAPTIASTVVDRPAAEVFTSEFPHIDAPRTWRVRGIDGPVRATVGVTEPGAPA